MTQPAAKPANVPMGRWRLLVWGAIVGLIMMPGLAMQFTNGVVWGVEDFALAAATLSGSGLAFEMAVRASGSRSYRGGVAVALGAGVSLLWANAAVGVIGAEDNDINMWFNLVPLVALFGAIGARFRAPGMALAMAATAAAQVVVGIAVQFAGHFTSLVTIVWAAIWLVSAWLFRNAGTSAASPVSQASGFLDSRFDDAGDTSIRRGASARLSPPRRP